MSSHYGKDSCPCVGIENLKGYYATQESFYHVQRSSETGATCQAWDDGKHPKCREEPTPAWCKQSWCYVDPCNCHLDVLPKQTIVGVDYQGTPAYWSYNTCGGMDFFSADMSPEACVMQKDQGQCSSKPKCAWNGKQCVGKELIETCTAATKLDTSVHGEEDCRCVGLSGKETGKAFMFVNEKDLVKYPPSIGATCKAWEMDSHPECLKAGDKPAWCSAAWCFVDPCKCKTRSPPKAVMGANKDLRFQGKTAYWSYETCGSMDSWTASHSSEYCPSQKSQGACSKMDKCGWNGKECLGKALVDICSKQHDTGVLGLEAPLPSSTRSREKLGALFILIAAIARV